MGLHNWIILAVIAGVFYYVGAKYPGGLAKIGLA